jgi:hypothetical protein
MNIAHDARFNTILHARALAADTGFHLQADD